MAKSTERHKLMRKVLRAFVEICELIATSIKNLVSFCGDLKNVATGRTKTGVTYREERQWRKRCNAEYPPSQCSKCFKILRVGRCNFIKFNEIIGISTRKPAARE